MHKIRTPEVLRLKELEARSFTATAEAYMKAKDVHLAIAFHRGNPLQNKDKVIVLLKQAAARL